MPSITLEAICKRNGLTPKGDVRPFLVEVVREGGERPIGGWCYGEMVETWTIPWVMMVNFEYYGFSSFSSNSFWFEIPVEGLPERFKNRRWLPGSGQWCSGAAGYAWQKATGEVFEAERLKKPHRLASAVTASFRSRTLSEVWPFRWAHGDRLLMAWAVHENVRLAHHKLYTVPLLSASVMRRAVRG